MHPYSRFAGLPPEGEVLAALCIEMLMGEMVPRGVLSHRFCGGKVVPQAPKGVHFCCGDSAEGLQVGRSLSLACTQKDLPMNRPTDEARLYGFPSVTSINSN